ncbi:uncharacterized protein [Rutidosis leptorrhynchoides]|uniref:uncharacterized protein n=1 Tax=Rutidosis leptorrhynchoides TaxID=125765 RepID=UPI003A99D104
MTDFKEIQAQRPRFLLRVYRGYVDDERERGEYCWIIDDDDDDVLQHRISLTYPKSVNRLLNKEVYKEIVGNSHGFLCFTSWYLGDGDSFNRYVMWNPSIRKSVSIDVPYNGSSFRVEVYTLSAGVWRSPLTKLPSEWFDIHMGYDTPVVVLNGFIYRCAYVDSPFNNSIVSFDLASEEFTKILVPDKLTNSCYYCIHLFKLGGSLGVVQSERCKGLEEEVHEVWIMDHVSKLLTKLFTITLPEMWKVVGFRDNEQLIIEKIEKRDVYLQGGVRGCEYRPELVAYDPELKHIIHLGLFLSFDYCHLIISTCFFIFQIRSDLKEHVFLHQVSYLEDQI